MWVLLLCVCGACRAEPPFGTSVAGGCEQQQAAEQPPPAFLFWAGRKWVIFTTGAQVFFFLLAKKVGWDTALAAIPMPCVSSVPQSCLAPEAFCCWVLSRPQPC